MAKAGGLNPAVQAWITKLNDPMYVTDLWLVVTERGKEMRIPACRSVLHLTCSSIQDLPEDGGSDMPVLGDHSAQTVVQVLQACYPFESFKFPNSTLGEVAKLTKFAHCCGAQKIVEWLFTRMQCLVSPAQPIGNHQC
jgi:hypothetical protein